MVCGKCNTSVQEGVQFCPNCGNKMSSVLSENPIDPMVNVENQSAMSVVNQNVGENPINNQNQINNGQDKVNIWLVILSWFIPLAGLIIFFVKKDSSPKTAKTSGICALVSAVLSIIIVVLTVSLLFGAVNKVYDNAKDKTGDLIEDVYENIDDQIDDMEDIIVTDDQNDSTTTDTSDTDTTEITNVSADWKQYQVGISGKVLTIPMTYSEVIAATGFNLKDTYANLTLPNDHYALVNLYKNDKLALYIELFNNSGAEAKYVDSKVTRISQTKYQVSQGAEAIVFPGGIKVGDTITDAQITSLFGTPNDLKESENSKQYTYLSDTTWTTTNNFKIKIVNGIIDEIQLDHRR